MRTHLYKKNVDPSEVAKFSKLASHWWDLDGELKSLHDINPLRVAFINELTPVKNQKILDVGCGGGILAESLALLGAKVTGIDMSQEALNVANWRQAETKIHIEYVWTTAEKIASEKAGQYDIVTCLEMLEHVPDPVSIIQACAKLLKPNGEIFFSTLSRNIKSYLSAIIGAEYVLQLVPKNTHDYAKFILPAELAQWCREAGLSVANMTGLTYNPFTKKYSLTKDTSVNYIMHLKKN